MKRKNLIYTLCILLSGVFMLNSCEDMLDVESERVQYDFGNLTANDTVYSVLGILKGVQNVADRQIILNELRGDLVTITGKAKNDLQAVAGFNNSASNKYNNAKDYYSIINNCNIFLERADTAMSHGNDKFFLREYVAVISVRAWTYMQLANLYGAVPYFEKPLYTHADVKAVMAQPKLTIEEIAPILIENILPFEDPYVYKMPTWEGVTDGDGDKITTKQLFMPIRVLLGELYLASGKYREAADIFHKIITRGVDNNNSPIAITTELEGNAGDRTERIFITGDKGQSISNNYSSIFFDKNELSTAFFTIVPMMQTEENGTVSELDDIFSSDKNGEHQAAASKGHVSLSANQMHYYRHDNGGTGAGRYSYHVNTHKEMNGDLRIFATTTRTQDAEGNVYNNIIKKFNFEDDHALNTFHRSGNFTSSVALYRDKLVYLRFAEAILGLMKNEGFEHGSPGLVMAVLKDGLNEKYTIEKNYHLEYVPVMVDKMKQAVDDNGDPVYEKDEFGNDTEVPVMVVVKEQKTDDDGNLMFEEDGVTPVMVTVQVQDTYQATDDDGNPMFEEDGVTPVMVPKTKPTYKWDEQLSYNFGVLTNNSGMHVRGSGDAELSPYYALSDTCIARYLGILSEPDDNGIREINRSLNAVDTLNYLVDLVIDELAFEFAFEGYRFTDLVRFAKAYDDVDILAKRVAGRDEENTVTYRDTNFSYDSYLYDKLKEKSNWYLSLPDGAYIPVAEDEEWGDAVQPPTTDEGDSAPAEPSTPEEDEADVVTPVE